MEKSSINFYKGTIDKKDILALTNTVLAGIPYGLKTSFPDNPQIQQPITIIGFKLTNYPDYTKCYGIGNGECQWHPISGKFTGALLDLYAITQGIERMGTFGIVNVDIDNYPYPLIEYQYNTNLDENEEEIGWENYILKPYLLPKNKINSLITAKELSMLSGYELIDWYNANHIDYRGLIEKGLALEATEGMYKTE